VIRHMVGRPIEDLFPKRQSRPGDTLLSVKNLTVADRHGDTVLHDISFEVRAGEVLGIGGLMGSGRSETLMHIFGAWGSGSRGTFNCPASHRQSKIRAGQSAMAW